MQTTQNKTSSNTAGVARSAGMVAIAVFCSRILGLVREQVFASLFGASTAMDAFVVAFRIPNLLRDLFAEGALSAAFVTVFTEYEHKRSKEETWLLVNNVLNVLLVLLSVITLLGMYFAPDLVRLLAPHFSSIPGKIALTTHLTRIMFPFLIMVSVSALMMGLLNTRGKFFIPSMSSSCFNFGTIFIGGGLALIFPHFGLSAITGMAIGTLVGGLLQVLLQLPLLLKEGFRPRIFINLRDPGLRRIGKLIIPAIIGMSATQINIFINTNFASRCPNGSVSWLNYSFRLMQFPIGLFGIALSIATLPVLSALATNKRIKELGKTLVSSLSMAFACTVPAAIGLWILAVPIVRIVFQRGHFNIFDTLMTAAALKYYAIGLLAYSGVKIIVPAFYSLNDTKWPVIGSFLTVVINLIVVIATLKFLQHRAIALSTSVSVIVNFFFLLVVLYKKIGGYPLRELIVSFLKIAFSAIIMGAVIYKLYYVLGLQEGTELWIDMSKVCLEIVTAIIIYAGLLSVLKVPALAEVTRAVVNKIKR